MITYSIAPDAHLVSCRVTSDLHVLDAGDFMEVLFADPAFDGSHNILVVIAAGTVTPDIVARNALAELLLAWRKLHARAKVAFVLPGSAWRRMAMQLIERHALGARNVQCFGDQANALLWFQVSECAPAVG